jgi:hypothetical protein
MGCVDRVPIAACDAEEDCPASIVPEGGDAFLAVYEACAFVSDGSTTAHPAIDLEAPDAALAIAPSEASAVIDEISTAAHPAVDLDALAAALVFIPSHPPARPLPTLPLAPPQPRRAPTVTAPVRRHYRAIPKSRRSRRRWRVIAAAVVALVVLAAVSIGIFGQPRFIAEALRNLAAASAVKTVVERIMMAESHMDPNAKNKRSSATGASQFIDQTWLELMRAHRPDLAARGEKEMLDLRRNMDVTREITARFVERNAANLRARCLPVTPGTLYLSHFAGGAGAAAILTAPSKSDAAAIMAGADSTGRMTRDKIVKANPFLERFTADDLRAWADRKMRARETGAESIFAHTGATVSRVSFALLGSSFTACRQSAKKT